MSTLADHNPGSPWICPLCKSSLKTQGRSWVCSNNHNFDMAREGYVNLLPVQKKKSKAPGDTAESIAARREFLASGHYSPLVKKIGGHIKEICHHRQVERFEIIDSGCGEGYYSGMLLKLLTQNRQAQYFIKGFDIARPAVKAAARAHPDIRFAVASAFEIPCNTASQDCVLQIFSPAAESELHRILKRDGIYISVSPGENHLIEIRRQLYNEVKVRAATGMENSLFECTEKTSCEFTMHLTSDAELSNLFRMTPHFWKASAEKRAEILKLEKLDVTASFVVSVYKKREIKTTGTDLQ